MPHIIVEHSAQTIRDKEGLVKDLHQALATYDTITIASIKTRCIAVYPCVVGNDDTPNLMVHITLKLMPGRDDDLKTKMAQNLVTTAQKYVDKTVSVTAEVTELHAASYQK